MLAELAQIHVEWSSKLVTWRKSRGVRDNFGQYFFTVDKQKKEEKAKFRESIQELSEQRRNLRHIENFNTEDASIEFARVNVRRTALLDELSATMESKQLRHVETVVHGGIRIMSTSMKKSQLRRSRQNEEGNQEGK